MVAKTRVQMLQDVVMLLDGQTTIVLSGSVIDWPQPVTLSPQHYTLIGGSPTDTNPYPTSFSNVRKK